MGLIDLEVDDTPNPVWLKGIQREEAGWRKGVTWKAALAAVSVIVAVIIVTKIFSPSGNSSLFPGLQGHGDRPPTSTNPNITYLDPAFFPDLNSERVKIRYGPFDVPSNDIHDGMAGFKLPNATKPCSDCLITFMQADLQYADGTIANANNGLWLHHMVLLNQAQKDTVCPRHPERMLATGNERTAATICIDGTKEVGYYLSSASNLLFTAELMNETPSPNSAYITVTYEYIPQPPPHFRKVRPVWLDVGGPCGNSDYPVPENQSAFNIIGDPWTADISGGIMLAAAHPHDGGLVVDVLKDGMRVCTSTAKYGVTKGYVEPDGMKHISNMSVCTNIGRMEKGQKWTVEAKYDLEQHAPMMGSNGPEPVMGIALLYVAEDKEEGELNV